MLFKKYIGNNIKYVFSCSGFQKRVLFLLTDIKENIKLLARKSEHSDSDCYLDQITEPQQLQELEKELSGSSDAKTQMVIIIYF